MRPTKQISNEITAIEIELDKAVKALQRDAKAKIDALQKELKESRQLAVIEARERIKAILAEHNLDPDAIIAGIRTRAAPPPPTNHYVGPEGQIWLGRGPHPAWLKGKDKKQFERPGLPGTAAA